MSALNVGSSNVWSSSFKVIMVVVVVFILVIGFMKWWNNMTSWDDISFDKPGWWPGKK